MGLVGRGLLSSEAIRQNERVIAGSLLDIRPTTAIDSVMWVYTRKRNKGKMDPERQQRLEALPGWSWELVGRGLLSSEADS